MIRWVGYCAVVLVAAFLAWPPAYAAPKNCGSRLEMETFLNNKLQQQMGFALSSSVGRLELWTTEPKVIEPGIKMADRWTGLRVDKKVLYKEMCVETEGVGWVFMSWEEPQ